MTRMERVLAFAELCRCPGCGAHIKRSPQEVEEIQQDWDYWKDQKLICLECYNAAEARDARRDGWSHYLQRVENVARKSRCDCSLVSPRAAGGYQFEVTDLVRNVVWHTPVYATLAGAARCAIRGAQSVAATRRYSNEREGLQ